MSEQFRFMNELVRIVNGALRLDIDRVRNYTSFLADKLQEAGDITAAERLRKTLQETDHQLRPAKGTFHGTVPVDSESRFPLLERVDLRSTAEPPVVLADEQWDVVREFLSVAKSEAQVDHTHSGSSLNLLMYGPPGTGKSRLARYIATELGLELYVARLDGLISSFLGSTAKNIRALFEFASKTPCVLFLDEFDALAKLRGDTQELGELKRIVNSFIQNLDSLASNSIVIAATNHESLLDPAVWRRFSYRLPLSYPLGPQRSELLRQFLVPIVFEEKDLELLTDLTEGFSGSDLEDVARRLKRRQIANGDSPALKEAFQVLQNVAVGEGEDRRVVCQLRGLDEEHVANVLRTRNADLYSHAAVARLFGVSKATAFRRAKKGTLDHGEHTET